PPYCGDKGSANFQLSYRNMAAQEKSGLPGKLIRQLGKRSDRQLAEEYQVSLYQVRAERQRRGIHRYSIIDWTPGRLAMLGKMPDAHIAAKIGATDSAVFVKRVSLGIPAFGLKKQPEAFQWKASQLKQLGRISDSALAAELGTSVHIVIAKRHSLGVPPANPRSDVRKPWSRSEIAMLGKKPDPVVAAITGRGRRHIRAKRESLGIPPFQQQTNVDWTPAVVRRLGKRPDQEVAAELGVSVGTVALHRRRMGIPAYRRGITQQGGSSKTRRR
ncbi:MAG: hypothetical protein ACK50J_04565, partial [Planctomyces sp.]